MKVSLVALSIPVLAFAAGVGGTKIPNGTAVQVTVSENVSSKTAQEGAAVECKAADDVRLGEILVVQKDAPGKCRVISVEKEAGGGRGGMVEVQVDFVQGVDKNYLKVEDAKLTAENGQSKNPVHLTPAGLFKKGKPAVISKGQTASGYLVGGQEVQVANQSASAVQ